LTGKTVGERKQESEESRIACFAGRTTCERGAKEG